MPKSIKNAVQDEKISNLEKGVVILDTKVNRLGDEFHNFANNHFNEFKEQNSKEHEKIREILATLKSHDKIYWTLFISILGILIKIALD